MSRNADGLTPMQEKVAELLWQKWADPEGAPAVKIFEDPRNIAKVIEPALERDEYHTMAEVYDYRMLYNAHAAKGWHAAGIPVVKSWFHSDGEPCFGGKYFVVVATLPTGQVSNHYRLQHWRLFDIPAVSRPPVYDGHTPAVAAERLRAHLEGRHA